MTDCVSRMKSNSSSETKNGSRFSSKIKSSSIPCQPWGTQYEVVLCCFRTPCFMKSWTTLTFFWTICLQKLRSQNFSSYLVLWTWILVFHSEKGLWKRAGECKLLHLPCAAYRVPCGSNVFRSSLVPTPLEHNFDGRVLTIIRAVDILCWSSVLVYWPLTFNVLLYFCHTCMRMAIPFTL